MHLTPEELATVSRLRRLKAGDLSMSEHGLQCDTLAAADILLRLLPEDDGEAVTEEWLRSIGELRKAARSVLDEAGFVGVKIALAFPLAQLEEALARTAYLGNQQRRRNEH